MSQEDEPAKTEDINSWPISHTFWGPLRMDK